MDAGNLAPCIINSQHSQDDLHALRNKSLGHRGWIVMAYFSICLVRF